MKSLEKKLSIIICTRNRAESLYLTLSYLKKLKVPQDWLCRFIFVNNGSSDKTSDVLSGFATLSKVECLILDEPRPGLSTARNTALEKVDGGVVVFTDDDCCPSDDWLERIALHFSSMDSADILGGRVELYNNLDIPITINSDRNTYEITTFTSHVTQIMGCNLSFRINVIADVGLFDMSLGAGSKFLSAEDTDFNTRCLAAGYKIRYDPTVLVFHNHGRRTESEREKLMKGYARGRGALYAKNFISGQKKALREFYWELRSFFRGFITLRPLLSKNKITNFNEMLELCFGFFLGWLHYR